jgi:hypothetical protein
VVTVLTDQFSLGLSGLHPQQLGTLLSLAFIKCIVFL